MKIIKYLLDILRGAAIGIANVIPGVSGGTIAVSMGIYDKILDAVNNLFKKFKKSILTLIPYGIGIVIGIIGLAKVIGILFEKFPLPTIFLFIGLIFGGIPLLLSKIAGHKINVFAWLIFIVFLALMIYLPFLGEGEAKSFEPSVLTAVKMLLAGILASATMVIPGVSGSAMMMAIGYYTTLINSINEIIDALKALDFAAMAKPVLILLPFGIGVIIGILGIARLIGFLMKKALVYTYAAIMGLVIASPYSIFVSVLSENGAINMKEIIASANGFKGFFGSLGKLFGAIGNNLASASVGTLIASVATLLVGGAIAYFMSRGEIKESKESAHEN